MSADDLLLTTRLLDFGESREDLHDCFVVLVTRDSNEVRKTLWVGSDGLRAPVTPVIDAPRCFLRK